jgi:probable phosphoglycerate mutase
VSEETVDDRVYRQHRFVLPPGATDILVVRHGESMPGRVGDPVPTWEGHADPALAPEGEAQAERIAERLVGAGIDALYVTPLRRTAQTAAPLAARLSLTPVVVPDLVEVHLGEWEGLEFRRRSEQRDPLVVQAFVEQRWEALPGAERTADLTARVRRGIATVAAAHPDQRVVVVVHGGVIGELFAIATGSHRFAFVGADNASISQLVVDGERWSVRRFNDTTHLDPTLTVAAAPPQ